MGSQKCSSPRQNLAHKCGAAFLPAGRSAEGGGDQFSKTFFREERIPKGKTKHTGKESRKEEFMSGKVQGAKLKSKRSAPKRAPTKTGFKTKNKEEKTEHPRSEANGVSFANVLRSVSERRTLAFVLILCRYVLNRVLIFRRLFNNFG